MSAISQADGPFTARELAIVTSLTAAKVQLAMAFWCTCGLIQKAPGRGVYQPMKAATAMATAWQDSESRGRRAVRDLLRSQWFAKSARGRLAEGPGLREGLVARLIRLAQVGKEYRLEVEMLVDLMVEVGLLVPQAAGYLSWYEYHKAPSLEGIEAEAAGDEPETPTTHGGPAASAKGVPRPRMSADQAVTSSCVEDLVALLNRPVQLADLPRLSAEDLLSLHGHLAGLATLATKLRSRPSNSC